jgi:hypothetical protein
MVFITGREQLHDPGIAEPFASKEAAALAYAAKSG